MKNTNIIHFNITINTDSVFMVFAMFSHWHAKKKIVITTLLKHSCAWLEWPKPVRLTDQDFFVTEKKAPLKCNTGKKKLSTWFLHYISRHFNNYMTTEDLSYSVQVVWTTSLIQLCCFWFILKQSSFNVSAWKTAAKWEEKKQYNIKIYLILQHGKAKLNQNQNLELHICVLWILN